MILKGALKFIYLFNFFINFIVPMTYFICKNDICHASPDRPVSVLILADLFYVKFCVFSACQLKY